MPYSIEEAAQNLMVEEEELLEVLDIFVTDTSNILKLCEAAFKSKDYETLKKNFHALKGTSANFRAAALSDIAASMERAITSGDDRLLSDLFASFRSEFEEIRQIIALYSPKAV